ncbi:BA75_04630T0 [Komagataella pastoris]|uniref:BA75_04630T0 n=1 Tax=Komagataella pastoris TaxID=4922 RepID=A0A1B2JHS3_PICPA|nr:BA75_04630T0 [Komagataella pastoris]
MSEAIISYAALILADAGKEISADNLSAIAKAAGASVDQVWVDVFAKGLEGKDLKELLFSFATSGPATGGAAAGGAAAAAGESEAAAAEEAEEEKEESDDDMGFGLFD